MGLMKKPIIDESAVDYIRQNKEALALRHPGLFLIFRGSEILGKFKTSGQANAWAVDQKLECYVIWRFDPLPDTVAAQLLHDEAEAKRARARELARLRQKKYYEKNKAKVLAQQKARKSAEQNRALVKAWYYADHQRTLAMKKCQRLGVAFVGVA